MSLPVTPVKRLAVEVFQSRKRASGKKGFAYIPDRSFHAPFLIAGAYLTRAGREMIMGAQIQEPGMKADGVAPAFHHRTAKVVIQQDSGQTGPVSKGMHVATQEALHALIEEELEVERPRVGERYHETGKPPAGSTDGHLPKMSPIDLALFPSKCAQAKKGFLVSRAQTGDYPSQLDYAARVTAIPDHLVDPGGQQARIFFQRFSNEPHIGICYTGAQRLGVAEAFCLYGVTDPVRVQREFARDRSDFPVLGVEQVTNPGTDFLVDHVSPQSMKRIHEPARPMADDAVRYSGPVNHSNLGRWFAAVYGGGRWCDYRQEDIAKERAGGGTLIRHARFSQALTIGSLTVSMIKCSFKSLLMAEVRCPSLFPATSGAAAVTTILLSPIAVATDPKDSTTTLCPAKSLTENNFACVFHPRPKARLDNSCRSWQLNAICLRNLINESCCQWALVEDTTGASLLDLPGQTTRR
jgi:hypothetical protein